MSRPLSRPHQSSCPLTPGHDLPTHSRHNDLRTGLTMSASTSSFKHASSYGFAHREQSSTTSYSPLRRLQHLTSMVSQPDLVLPMREPVRVWDWAMNKKDRGQETDSWADCTASGGSCSYSSSQATSREETLGKSDGQKQLLAQSREKEAPSGGNPEKKSDVCFSGPPSPAFSLDSNSPFANGFLHFESSLFEDDDNDEDQGTKSTEGSSQVKEERPEGSAQLAVNSDSNRATSSAKVVTRSQSSGQRRRYWDGSDDEWDSDTELFLFGDTYSVQSMASSKSIFVFVKKKKTKQKWLSLCG